MAPAKNSGVSPYGIPPGFDAFASVANWRIEGRRVQLTVRTERGRTAHVTLSPAGRVTWKITVGPPGAPSASAARFVLRSSRRLPPLAVVRADGKLLVRGPTLDLEIGLSPWRLRVLTRRGREILADNPADVDGLGRPFVPGLGFIVSGSKPSAVTASFRLGPDERLYGLGEKFTRLDKAGQRIVSWTVDALGSTSERSHKNIPFLWSTNGWGLFLDTAARVTWDLGTRSCQSWTAVAETGRLDIYIMDGPRPARLLAAYARLTGHAALPPKWSFGLWLSSGGTYRDQPSVEALLDAIERRKWPADVVHIDTWWMRRRQYCDFVWDRKTFPDPEGLIARIHALGLKLCLWEHPYISVESPLFEFCRERGYLVRKPDRSVYIIDYGLSLAPRPDGVIRKASRSRSWNPPVAIIDLTKPEAAKWFRDLHRPLLRMGVDAFKTDFGEDIPEDAVFHDGRTGATMHNLYPLLYNEAVFGVVREEKGRGIVWSRSGAAGSQRFPVGWSGDPASDFDSLASTVRGGLSAGLSGLPFWACDIGGYRGRPDPELYVRWAQFGLLCSHSRMHGDSPREPWAFGEKAARAVRRVVDLRYRLFPYLWSTALEARRTGMPVLRALPVCFPEDPNAAGWDFEYMLGPWLLVAPVVEPGRAGRPPLKTVYLPPGRWIEDRTGREIAGPAVLRQRVPFDAVPLFIRLGAIIPTMKPAARIPEDRPDPLIVEVFPGGNSSYDFLEDAGRTRFRLRHDGRRAPVLEWSGPGGRSIHLAVQGRNGAFSPLLGRTKTRRLVRLPEVRSGKIVLS